jgi:superfamily I DNA and/or RNA helicase
MPERAVVMCRGFAGDCAGVLVTQLYELLDTAGRVVEGEGLHSGMLGEESAALSEGYGMREDAINVANRGAGDGDEIVTDSQEAFAHHLDVMLEQEIEVLQH